MRRKDFLKKFYIPKDFSHLLDPTGKPLTEEETAFVACYDRREFMKKTSKALIWIVGAGVMSKIWQPTPARASRLFNGTDERLDHSAALITGYPFSIHAWVYLETIPSVKFTEENIFISHTSGTFDNMYNFRFDDGNANKLQLNVKITSGVLAATTGNIVSADVWSSCFCTGASATSRTAILNGDIGNKGTSTGSLTPSGGDKSSIGSVDTGSDFTDGRIAEVVLWGANLTDNEAVALSNGISQYRIRPGSITNHWPLYGRSSPEPDIIGGADMTLVNTPTQADHSPGMPTFALRNERSFQTAAAPAATVDRRRLIKTN